MDFHQVVWSSWNVFHTSYGLPLLASNAFWQSSFWGFPYLPSIVLHVLLEALLESFFVCWFLLLLHEYFPCKAPLNAMTLIEEDFWWFSVTVIVFLYFSFLQFLLLIPVRDLKQPFDQMCFKISGCLAFVGQTGLLGSPHLFQDSIPHFCSVVLTLVQWNLSFHS